MAGKQIKIQNSSDSFEMAKKQMEVLEWLREMHTHGEVPHFERNGSNINKLHHLMYIHQEACKDRKKVHSYLKSKSGAHHDEYKRLRNELELFFSPGLKLDDEEQRCLDLLGSLWHMLHLHTTSPSNVMLAINSLEEDCTQVGESLKKEQLLTANLLDFSKTIGDNLEQLNRISEECAREACAREQAFEKEEIGSKFSKDKMRKYEEDLKALEEKLNEVNFEENVKCGTISRKMEELEAMEKELANKLATLGDYSLPPDMTLAQSKVEEMRTRLSEAMELVTGACVEQTLL